MLSSTSPREALFACPLFPPWNLLSFSVESTLSSPRYHSDPPLTRQGAALAHLDSLPPHDLVLWTDGSVPFPFGKAGSGVLANCSLCGAEATLSFSACPVCSSFSAEACAILHALCWSRQHQQVCHFSSLLFYLTLALSSPPCPLLHLSFYLKLSGRNGRNCLLSPPVLSGYNGSPDTHFSRETMRLSWPEGEHCLHSPQSLVVSLLLSLVSTLIFSRTGSVLSHQNSLTHRFARFPPRNLYFLVMLAVFSLVYAATDAAFCSVLVSLKLRALPAALADTSHFILHCPATDSFRRSLFGDSLSLYDLWSRPWEAAKLWGSMVFRHASTPRKWSVDQQQSLTYRTLDSLRGSTLR